MIINNCRTLNVGHDLSNSEGDDEPSTSTAAAGRVTFPTLVTKSDFEDSEDIAEGAAAGKMRCRVMPMSVQLCI